MREYGEENFEIEVLEELYTDDIAIVNQREQYWIQEKESFRGTGKGYNSDLGGRNRIMNSILPKEDIMSLKQEIKEGVSYLELEKKYNVSSSFISSINHGVYFHDENEHYPLFQYYRDDADYDELIILLTESTLPMTTIAEYCGFGYSTVKKINAGTLRHGLYPDYPIRKETTNQFRARKIKDTILNTNFDVRTIAEMYEVSTETVYRIIKGQTFFDENLNYPLRNL